MKKCLLSILAGALLIVSCQNYDDQFDDLNSQITALASQVAGLSKVQSDLTALQGTVSSLQGNIASSVDSALASGLAGINAAVDNLQSQIDGIASSEEVAAIQSDVTAAQADLTELLNNSNVFTGDLTVTTASQLNAALAYGTKIAIVNGNVDFQVDASMNIDSVQTVINRLGTVVKDFSYVAAASSVSPVTFDNITGVTSLTVKQGGDYSFKGLESATNVHLNDGFKSKVKIIHFGALKTVTKFNTVTSTGTDDHAIVFPKVTELHLTSLTRYSGTTASNPLKLHIDEGNADAPTVIAMGALEDKDASGKQANLYLSIEGPNSVAISKITDGKVTFRNVIDASINSTAADIVVSDGVQTFASDGVVSIDVSNAKDLTSLDITGIVNPDTAAASQEAGLPNLTFTSTNGADLETVKLRGKINTLSIDSAGSLVSVDIDGADIANSVNLSNNTDLTSVVMSSSTKLPGVTFNTNADLETINGNATFRAAAGGTKIDGSYVITGNTSLGKVILSSAGLETLTITGNDDLTTIESTLTTIGASAAPAVNIYGNDFTASAVVDTVEAVGVDGTAADGEGKAGNEGSMTTTSGMEGMKTYLAAVGAAAKGTAAVYWDTVEAYTNEAGTETADIIYTAATIAANKELWILKKEADNAVAGIGSVAAQKAWLVVTASLAKGFSITKGSTVITVDNAGVADATDTMDSNPVLARAAILRSAALTRATAVGLTLDAHLGGNPIGTVTFQSNTDSATGELGVGTSVPAGAAVNTSLTATDYVSLTIDGLTVTATTNGTPGNNARDGIATALATAWNAKYATGGTSWTYTTVSTITAASGVLTIVAEAGSGRRAHNTAISLGVTCTSPSNGSPTINWKIGATKSLDDNKMVGNDIIVTLTSNDKGTILDKTVNTGVSTGYWKHGDKGINLTSTLNTVVKANTETAANVYPKEARGDYILPEDGTAGTASSAVNHTKVHWLSS